MLKRGRPSLKNYFHEISKLCNFIFPNNNKYVIYSATHSRTTALFSFFYSLYMFHMHFNYGRISNEAAFWDAALIRGRLYLSDFGVNVISAVLKRATFIWGPVVIRGKTVCDYRPSFFYFLVIDSVKKAFIAKIQRLC